MRIKDRRQNARAIATGSTGGIRRSAPKSMIYFIAADEVARVKIGWSIDPVSRLKELQTGCPVALRIVAAVPGTYSMEQQLHVDFAKFRSHGEWFAMVPEILHRIAEMLASGGGWT